MSKKIKIIDLYNMIANGKEIPKKIKYNGEIYHHNIFKTNYFRDDNGSTLRFVELNDYVEILEDNTEEIKEITLGDLANLDGMANNRIMNKINELVKAVNAIRKDLNNDK